MSEKEMKKNKAYTVAKYDIRDFNMVCEACNGMTPFIKTRVKGKHECAHCGVKNEVKING